MTMAQDTKLVSVATGAVYSANLQTPVPIFPQLRFVHSLIDLGHGHYTSSIFFFWRLEDGEKALMIIL